MPCLNGLVFTSRSDTALLKSYGLKQQFITPYTPQQNGLVERMIRTLKEQCVHRHRIETLPHASRVISDWIQFYNHRRPHQALDMKVPAEAALQNKEDAAQNGTISSTTFPLTTIVHHVATWLWWISGQSLYVPQCRILNQA